MTKIFMVIGVVVCIVVAVACMVEYIRLRKEYNKAIGALYEACCYKYQFAAGLLDYARCYGALYITETDDAGKTAIKVMGYDEEGS